MMFPWYSPIVIFFLHSHYEVTEMIPIGELFPLPQASKTAIQAADLLTSSKVALNLNSHARLLRHGKANLCKKKLLYKVKYSLTLWLSLMLFWFVCVNTQKWFFVQKYAFLRRCCWCVWMAWSALRMQENCILRALNFKFSWGSMPPNPPSSFGANHSCKILDPPLAALRKWDKYVGWWNLLAGITSFSYF